MPHHRRSPSTARILQGGVLSDDTSTMRPGLCKQHHTFCDNAGQGQVRCELVLDGLQAQMLLLIDQR